MSCVLLFVFFFFSSRRRHTRCALVTGVQTCALPIFYVANTDALLAFPYVEGATKMAGKAKKIADLPAKGTNRHWTKSLVAAPNGWLYVGVGADSNIGERSEEHTSELQSLMSTSYAVFCLKKKKT